MHSLHRPYELLRNLHSWQYDDMLPKVVSVLVTISFVLCLTVQATAQVSTDRTASPSAREALLIDRIEKLERRLAELEAKLNAISHLQPRLIEIATQHNAD